MNLTTAVFLLPETQVRAVNVTYEDTSGAKNYLFKTFDQGLKVDDYCVVETDRAQSHKLTVVKITEVDVDFDLDSSIQMKWIIGKVDKSMYEQTLAQEKIVVDKIKNLELQRRRKAMANALFEGSTEEVKSLSLTFTPDVAPEPKP